jgi:hypothetical protein
MTVWLETLWNILQDDACKEYIRWNDQGDGFVISSIRASCRRCSRTQQPQQRPPPPPPRRA